MSVPGSEWWQGSVDEKLRTHADDIKELRDQGQKHDARLGILEVAVGKLAVKIGVAAAIGSLVGGGLVSLIVLYLIGGHHR